MQNRKAEAGKSGEIKYPARKSPRLKGFDYSAAMTYHVVLVTRHRERLFGEVVGSSVLLSPEGKIAADAINEIPAHYTRVEIDESIVMPDHVQILISICADPEDPYTANLNDIIRAYKSAVSRKCGRQVWQRSYYDHIIRNDKDYMETVDYIQGNPAEWTAAHDPL